MPKIKGLFAFLPGVTHISAENVLEWLKRKEDLNILENEIGNLITYPHVIPVSVDDISLNLAIIHEVIKLDPGEYFDKLSNRILIPDTFLGAVPDLQKLSWVFLDAFHPYGCTAIFLKTRLGSKNLGTLLKTNVISDGVIDIWLHGQKQQIHTGTIKVLSAGSNRIDIKFESKVCELLGRKSLAVEIIGGPLGLIVDASL